MANTSPFEHNNSGLRLAIGQPPVILQNAMLDYDDAEQPDSEITYSVTQASSAGQLYRDGVALGANATFTQADINAGRISFVHTATTAGSSSFTFQVTDGAGGYVGGKTFPISSYVNHNPAESVNTGLSLLAGDSRTLTSGQLLYGDAEQPDAEIRYTVTTAASGGTLTKNGQVLGLGGSFTQADIDAGALRFAKDSGGSEGGFGFQVTDGVGGYVGGKSFPVHPVAYNTSPVESVNSPLQVGPGGSRTITSANLLYGDNEQTDDHITYTITQGVTVGQLNKNGQPIGVGDSFTQADLDANRITYTHTAGGANTGSFGFQVTDGAGGYVGGKSFQVVATGFAAQYDLDHLSAADGRTIAYVPPAPVLLNDIDGDGYREKLATNAVPGTTDNREANIVWGTSTGFTSYSGLSPTAAQGFILANTGSRGLTAIDIGDINGDGHSDLGITPGTSNAPKALSGYLVVIFGRTSRPIGTVNAYNQDVVDLAHLPADRGFTINGRNDFNYPAALGDINGDGVADFAVGASGDYAKRGAIYVYYGSATTYAPGAANTSKTLDVATFGQNDGFVIVGGTAEQIKTIVSVGDVNGDGYRDMAVLSSRAYIIFGGPHAGTLSGGVYTVNLGTLTPDQGFVIKGGTSIVDGGDINADGSNELIINNSSVLFGSNSGFHGTISSGTLTVDPATFDGGYGFKVIGTGITASHGNVDVNGDGVDDLTFDAPAANGGAGSTYVLYGHSNAASASVAGHADPVAATDAMTLFDARTPVDDTSNLATAFGESSAAMSAADPMAGIFLHDNADTLPLAMIF